MMEYSEGNVKIGGVNIHYYRTGGDKPPFILLHGATDNGLCWTPVAEKLAADYDVIMPDAQGHGLSDRLGSDFTSRNHVKQVAGFVRELGLSCPIIMGHSMGAGTTTTVAAQYPELPEAIILEDPAWFDGGVRTAREEEMARERETHFQVLIGYQKLSLEEVINAGRKDNPLWSEAELKPWAAAKLQFDPALFEPGRIQLASYVEEVPKIRCPTLLITAENGIVTEETARKAAALWKSEKPFRWVRIAGAGHNIRREQFGEFVDALEGFLREIAG